MKTTLVILVTALAVMAFTAMSTGAEDVQPGGGHARGSNDSAAQGKECPPDVLTLFAISGKAERLENCLKRGASNNTVNVPTRGGLTALTTAAMNGRHEAVVLLLKHGGDPKATLTEATSYLINVDSKIANLYKQLLEKNKDMIEVVRRKHKNEDGTSQEIMITIQLSAGDKEAIKGFTPLHFACVAGEPQVVATLIANGADIRAKTAKGQTPLMLAAKFGHVDVARALVQGGLRHQELPVKDEFGLSALDYAKKQGKFYDLLRAFGVDEEIIKWSQEQDKRFGPLYKRHKERAAEKAKPVKGKPEETSR